ncbi:hypothetical protein [Pseudomonas sp. HS6]|uniref:hypothetical protein n=1 Tax=Pseudomonas sp. HS6 TaxID=2850559 RepID=UPI0020192302|nr:hypothetical protein [Pseudomonas sp. HS6]UQS17685.1 hypothetical protein JJN09_12740 [Pseudomonas sp. HS6]
MDALIHRISCLTVLAVAVGLSGCQNTSYEAPRTTPKKQTATDFDAMGRMEFDAAMSGQPDPDSIVRDGDYVSYLVISAQERTILHLARFDTHCKLPDAQMAHLTTGGMMRFAVNRQSDTPEGRQMPAEQKRQFLQSAQLKQVCAETAAPQWQVIAAPEQGDWQMIDRVSLKQKDGQTAFWSARVPAAEALMPSDNSLYAQERQRWSADCTQQRLTSLSTFYLDKQNRLLGGSVTRDPVARPKLDVDEKQLLTLVCGPRQALDHYKPFQGREQAAFVLPDPLLPASVVKAIEGLKLPAPEKDIRHLRLSFKELNEVREKKNLTGPDLSFIDDLKRRPLGRLGRDTTYLAYQPGKQLTERFDRKIHQSVEISFRGLTELAKVKYTSELNRIRVTRDAIIDLRFEGDWANMPVGSRLSYTVQRSSPRYQKAPALVDSKIECTVQSQKPASEFYSTLTGSAKVVSCMGEDYHLGQSTALYAYLSTYGMFVPIDLKQGRYYGQFKIEVAE